MSGGSYNYLCFRVKPLEEQRDQLVAMAERLQLSGYYQAARETRNVLLLVNAAEYAANNLTDVWQAVEWADSGDFSEEQVREAVRKHVPWPPEPEGA